MDSYYFSQNSFTADQDNDAPNDVINNHQVVRNNARAELFRRRSGKIIFGLSVFSSLVQVGFIAFVLIWTHADIVRIFPRIFLILYLIYHVAKVVQMSYHYRNPIQSDIYGVPIEPSERIPKFMFSLKIFLDGIFFLLMVTGFLAIVDAGALKTSPLIRRCISAIFIYNFIVIMLPVLMLLSFIFCFPCLIYVLPIIFPEPNRGASSAVIKKLPSFKFKEGDPEFPYGEQAIKISGDDACCSICLDKYIDGQMIHILQCNHHYHKKCSDQWFKIRATCPLCVTNIDPKENDDQV